MSRIMSYDRIWAECSEHPGKWHERRDFEEYNLGNGFKGLFDRLYAQGHYVVLVAGGNYCFDELFLYADASDAAAFYEAGFMEWESFIADGDEGCGFQEVSLYQDGRRVATKSCEPTKRAGTGQGDDSIAKFEKAGEFVEHDEETHAEEGYEQLD
jgi:hypothetical protein